MHVTPNEVDDSERRPGPEELLVTAAQAVASSSELESLSRPFLKLLHEITDLEAFYVTEIIPSLNEQRVLYGDSRTDLPAPEGRGFDWDDSLCKRVLESGTSRTSDVATELPGSRGATALGLTTFASVPIFDSDSQLLGTLCGMSRERREVPQRVTDVMIMLAGLMGEVWDRQRRQSAVVQRAEAAESQLRVQASFLAEAEHQLKPSLVQVKGWSDLLSNRWESMTTDRREQTLAALRHSAAEAVQQLDELLDESSAEALAERIQPRPLVVTDVVADVVDALREIAGERTISVAVEPGPAGEPASQQAEPAALLVLADRQALWQLLWYIGENAVQFTAPDGTVTVALRPDGERVVIRIDDDGVGLPAGVDVFAPYVGAGPGSDDRPGLGLYLARNLARGLGGSVTAESRPPRGSSFTVDLPRIT